MPGVDGTPRRVVVTGGSSGIGLECARRLTAAGARVALVARGVEALERAASSMHPRPPTAVADVGDVAALQGTFARLAGELGGIDVVVANAGAAAYGPFTRMSADDLRRTVDITLMGALNTAHVALPHLERARGTLVLVGSIAGRVPTPWLSAYAAAKHGVRGFARSLRAELRAAGVPVEVTLVAPGPVDTPFWQRARTTDGRLPPRVFGAYRPEDVAAAVERAIESPRPERTVGGLMAVWAGADALAPRLVLGVTGALAGIGWRRRGAKPPSPANALSDPAEEAEAHGDLPSRPSALGAVRDRP